MVVVNGDEGGFPYTTATEQLYDHLSDEPLKTSRDVGKSTPEVY